MAKLVRVSDFPVLVGGGLYFLILGWQVGDRFAIGSGCLAIGIAAVYPFFLPPDRMTVPDECIEEREWTSRRINYAEIWEVSVRYGEVFIKSYKLKKILVDNSLVEYERVMSILSSRLTGYDRIEYKGDPEEVFKYFHKVIPEDKGPTYPGY